MRIPWTPEEERTAMDRYAAGDPPEAIAKDLGRTPSSIHNKAKQNGVRHASAAGKPTEKRFEFITPEPKKGRDVETLLDDKADAYARLLVSKESKFNGIELRLDPGPFGLWFGGDPHLDDDGCDTERFCYELRTVNQTPHLHPVNMGDLTNNWLRALGHLHGKQATNEDEATTLIRWMLKATTWLWVVLGNHDKWSPLAASECHHAGVRYVSHGANFIIHAGDRSIKIDARHTHRGNSQYNPAFAQGKKNYRGSDADITIGAHTHTSGYLLTKNGITGKVGHGIRVGAFKRIDDYADVNDFEDGAISPSVVCVVDPNADEASRIHVFHDIHAGVRYLNALRAEYDRQPIAA